jgi:hypothetical protein
MKNVLLHECVIDTEGRPFGFHMCALWYLNILDYEKGDNILLSYADVSCVR